MNNSILYIAIDFYLGLTIGASEVLDGPSGVTGFALGAAGTTSLTLLGAVVVTGALGAIGTTAFVLLGVLLSALNLGLTKAGGISLKDDWVSWVLSKLTLLDSG
jgi:hypothetical protein